MQSTGAARLCWYRRNGFRKVDYVMLTEQEAVFRALQTDQGLRVVFHRTVRRVEGHLFISVRACHCVHNLSKQLKAQGIIDSWGTLHLVLASQRRATVTLKQRDWRTENVRKATRPKPGRFHTCTTWHARPSTRALPPICIAWPCPASHSGPSRNRP
jgi:hypothetical protein